MCKKQHAQGKGDLMKKLTAVTLAVAMMLPMVSCREKIEAGDTNRYKTYAKMTPEQITAQMTIEQKAAQMVQPAVYRVTNDDMTRISFGYSFHLRTGRCPRRKLLR